MVDENTKALGVVGVKKPHQRLLYPKWESNPHSLRNTSLSRARLPIPPFGQIGEAKVRYGLQSRHGDVVGVMHKSLRVGFAKDAERRSSHNLRSRRD